jgi:hypothetical protein
LTSHLLKQVVPAALLSAGVVVLTLGQSVAHAAVIHVHGAPRGASLAFHGGGGTGVGFVILGSAILALIVAGVVYAIAADRREQAAAVSTGEPARLSGAANETDSEEERKAA